MYTESGQGTGLAALILTDPSGPTYHAASWIQVTCQSTNNNNSDTLR